MLSATFNLWELVEVLPNKKWKCKFCGHDYDGGGTGIMAHLAGVGGYGIHGCKDVDARVRSEALKALQGERGVELSNKQGNVEEGLVTASNEDALRETSIAAMPYLSSGAEEEEPDTEVSQGKKPRLTDPFSELVEVLPNKKWKCKFCWYEYDGGGTRIKAHFAGVGGYGIHGCKVVDAGVRSEALKALQGERVVELSNKQGNVEEGLHQPVTASNEDASRETSIAAMPYLSSGAGSSAFLQLPDNQSLPDLTNMQRPLNAEEEEPNTEVSKGKKPRLTDPFSELVEVLPNKKWKCKFCGYEYDGGGTSITAHFAGVGGYGIHGCKVVDAQVRSKALKALQGERVVELSNKQGNVEEGLHQLVTAGNEDASRETSIAAMPYLSSGAGSSAFLQLPDNQSLPDLTNMQRPLNVEEEEPDTEVSQGNKPRLTDPFSELVEIVPYYKRKCDFCSFCGTKSSAFVPLPERNFSYQSLPALTNMPRPLNAKEGEPYTEVLHGARIHVAPAESQPGTCRLADTKTTSLKRKLEELISSRQADMNELTSKWRRIEEEYRSVVRAIHEGKSFPPEKVVEVEVLSKEFEEALLVPGRSVARCSKTSPSVTIELVGKETRRKVNDIISYLMQDNFSIIGVFGMGGVGKTAILRHVYNRLLEDLALEVFWVAVPQDFSVYALQEEIAKAVGLDNLSNEKDVKRRASLLYGHLNVKNRSILILDGLWMHFEVKDVGISVETGKHKLVVTTRSLDVCRTMLCQKQIKIEVLDMEDSWSLFSKLCFAGRLPSEVEPIARYLVRRCCGLPLGIIEIATRMRGVEKVQEWRVMLTKLGYSMMELDMFKRLQLSYLNLGNDQVQQCFLHLVLCFGDFLSETSREDLIESFIDEGLLGGIATRQGLHDWGNTILDIIIGACLLDQGIEQLYLHPLTRDMALDTAKTTIRLVRGSTRWEEIPKALLRANCLEKVVIQGSKIVAIPYGVSPNWPKLMRLSLNRNFMLRVIHESFFRHLKGLTVLDLSDTGIMELPDSISQLESLEALLLRICWALRFIPYVGKLRSLRKLDLKSCGSLEDVPEGMEMLVNLRYLALDGTKIKTLSEGVLEKLVNLQYLAMKRLRAGKEVKLTEVEALHCSVADVETFNACVGSLERNSSRWYRLLMGAPCAFRFYGMEWSERSILIDSCDRIAASVDGTTGDGCALLPESVQSLELVRCHKMKRVMEWEWLTTRLPNLKELMIDYCDKLEEIIGGPLPSGATCRLTHLEVSGCNNMKRVVLTQDVLLLFPFLQEIIVEDCRGIEVIIGTVAKAMHCSFPKLMNLRLRNLPELKSLCDGTRSCDSLRWISIDSCPKLKRIPLHLPLLDNGLPSPPPSVREIWVNRQTWESLEWDHPLARSSLEHFVKFLD